jgi:photosystem II stability/assembly factor-like uncharacterized protein
MRLKDFFVPTRPYALQRNNLVSLALLPFFLSGWLMAYSQKISLPACDKNDPVPDWVALMYAQEPNIKQIDEAFQEWYKTHPFEKTTYTQYYKKWRRAVNPYLTKDGYVQFPSTEAIINKKSAFAYKIQHEKSPVSRDASWSCLGPFEMVNDAIDGEQKPVSWQANVYCADQSKSNPDILFCGTEGSEIYKTIDRGVTWTPASRNLLIEAVTAVEINPTNPDIVFAGDRNGIYRTTNGGMSWTTLLVESQLNVNDIAIHPLNTNIVFVAAEKGFWRSYDGGIQWTKVYNQTTYDVELKPDAPDVVYLLKDNPAEKRCEFWKSTNAGMSFILKSAGWFAGTDPNRSNGGARMTVTPADPNRIYTVLIGEAKADDNGFIGVYRSNDAGESWTLPNPPAGGPYSQSHPNLAVINPFAGTGFHQGYYNLGIAASHENANQLLVGHLSLWRSTDGGATFQIMGGYGGSLEWIHPDVQDIKVLGKDTWLCTDGGINYSTNFFTGHESRKKGITGSDYWGFGQGWNDDILVGGRYHNGNSGWYQTYPNGVHIRLGGAESPTGYVSPGPGRRTYFSDIGGKVLPQSIEEASVHFPVSQWPNEAYYPAESSEQVWAPDCYNHYWLGNEDKLWKTEDGGTAFALIQAFDQADGGAITQIAVCRNQPEVMYVAQRNAASWSEGWVWKTSDSGKTWISLPLPDGYKRRFLVTVSAVDPNMVWLGYTDGNIGEKIFQSIDGGLTWQNITPSLLNDESVQTMVHIAGTEGSLVVGTNKTVYYRSGINGTWVLFQTGLPDEISSNIIRPFYRDAKLRLGAYGKGIWETPLPESFQPIIQPSVDKKVAFCARDTFYFDDHSVLDHTDASWSWTFPEGSPATASGRNPKVVYPGPGTYIATMTIDGPFGTLSKPLQIEVRNECEPDTVPGFALRLQEEGDAAIVRDIEDEPLSALTFSAWVKPEGVQPSYAGIIIGTHQGDAFGLNVRDNNQLGYHWPGGAWWWDSGLQLIPDEWQHVALVLKPGSITIYHNGISSTHNTNAQPVNLTSLTIGRYRDWSSRTFKGFIDEVGIWDEALTQEAIREHMHLTKVAKEQPHLIAYYQFNRLAGEETDRIGIRHLQFSGTAQRAKSTAPIGAGVSARQTVDSGGTYPFGSTGVSMLFGDTGFYPNGELVVSRIDVGPDVYPEGDSVYSKAYWIVNNYGQAVFDPIKTLTITGFGEVYPENVTDPTSLSLHFRNWNGEGSTWQPWATATSCIAGPIGEVSFSEQQDLGQWVIGNALDPVSPIHQPEVNEKSTQMTARFYPNPAKAGQEVKVMTNMEGPCNLRLLNAKGIVIYRGQIQDNESFEWGNWPAGIYYYEIQNTAHMVRGSMISIE